MATYVLSENDVRVLRDAMQLIKARPWEQQQQLADDPQKSYGWDAIALARAVKAIPTNATGDATMYAGTPGSETASTTVIQVTNKFGGIAAGEWVICGNNSAGWYALSGNAGTESSNCHTFGDTDLHTLETRPINQDDFVVMVSAEDGCAYLGLVTKKCCGADGTSS